MINSEEFKEGIFENAPRKRVRSAKVIKNPKIKFNAPVTIKPAVEPKRENRNAQVETLEKNGIITGLIINCSCGEQIQVLLEYAPEEQAE